MKTKNILLTLLAIAIIGAGVYFFKGNNSLASISSNKTVNVGAVLALTGYAAADGENIKGGIELAKADLQKEGITLNVDYYDDATDPKQTVAGVNYMNGKGIKTIFGPTWSYQISAALPVLKQNGMTAVIADSSSDIVDGSDQDKDSLIHGISPIYQIQAPTEKWLKENKVNNLAIFTLDGTWGVVHTNAWTKAAENTGVKVIMKEQFTYANEGTMISTLIVKAKLNKVDGIVWTGTDAGVVVLIKKMQELNYNVPVLGSNYIKQVLDEKKVELKGLNLSVIESPRSLEFDKKYQQAFGKVPSKYAEPSYDLTMMTARAEIAKGNMTTHDYLVSKEQKGFARNYIFDKKGDITNLYWTVTPVK